MVWEVDDDLEHELENRVRGRRCALLFTNLFADPI